MPAPRPPKLTRPSPVEAKRAAQQIAGSQRLTAEKPLVLSQSPAGFNFSIDTSDWIFLARLTGVYTVTGGFQNGLNLYSFIEQSYDPFIGIPLDKNPALQTYPQPPSIPTSAYALELNNALITVPGTTPADFVNPGPYVWMRLRGIVNSVPVYEFSVSSTSGGGGSSGQLFAWVKTPSLPLASPVPGKSYSAYAVNVVTSTGSSYTLGAAAWLVADLNAEYLLYSTGPSSGQTIYPVASNWIYQARQIDTDSNNVPVYQIASWHEANWHPASPGYDAWAGIVNTGLQNFSGTKGITGNLDVGFDVYTGQAIAGPGYASYGGNILCYTLTANPPNQPYGTNGGYGTVIDAVGNIAVVNGAITWSQNGQWPTQYDTTLLPDSHFLSLYAYGTGGASVGVGDSNIFFSGGGLTSPSSGVAQPGLFIGAAGQFVEGMTGSLSDGTQVVSGLVIAAGNGSGGGSSISGTNVFVDDGSLW